MPLQIYAGTWLWISGRSVLFIVSNHNQKFQLFNYLIFRYSNIHYLFFNISYHYLPVFPIYSSIPPVSTISAYTPHRWMLTSHIYLLGTSRYHAVPCMILHDPAWLCMILHDYVCCMILHNHTWTCMILQDPEIPPNLIESYKFK